MCRIHVCLNVYFWHVRLQSSEVRRSVTGLPLQSLSCSQIPEIMSQFVDALSRIYTQDTCFRLSISQDENMSKTISVYRLSWGRWQICQGSHAVHTCGLLQRRPFCRMKLRPQRRLEPVSQKKKMKYRSIKTQFYFFFKKTAITINDASSQIRHGYRGMQIGKLSFL